MKKEVLDILDILEEITNICVRMADKLYEKSNYDDIEFYIFSIYLEKISDRISNLKEENKEVL